MEEYVAHEKCASSYVRFGGISTQQGNVKGPPSTKGSIL